jgi:methylthioribose-1-phosphate isomerase
MRREAELIVAEATDDHGRLAQAGLAVLPDVGDRELRLLTHCNTGSLACGQFGTALGIVQAAFFAERPLRVWVDETRPYLQGARLTAWELAQAGVPYTLIPDVAAGSLMAGGLVDAVLVGADRVAANGDTANKVGTYPLSVLAARHGVPFYVCAPLSSVDLETPDGAAIPLEERPAKEVTEIRGQRIAPAGAEVWNPAFDMTPADLITGIVTEEGVLRPPFGPALRAAMDRRDARRAAAAPAAVASVAAPAPAAPGPAG